MTVTCRGQTYHLMPEPFWHLSHPTAGFLLHNVPLAEGLCVTISEVNRLPDLESAISLYGLRAKSDEKEIVWEAVRSTLNPNLPGRRGAMFLFDNLKVARSAMLLWFPREQRDLLEARVVQGSRLHKADAKWLDCDRDRWKECARNYWSGAMTDDPVPEVLVDGAVYFPGWRSPPFGRRPGTPPASPT